MIFFGSKGKVITGAPIAEISCPDCGNNGLLSFGIIKYFHLYWIPTFPTSKTVGAECTHCRRALTDNEISPVVKDQIKSSLFSARRSLPMFSGSIIIALILAFGAYTAHNESLKTVTYLEQPAVNDIYQVDFFELYEDSDPTYKYGAMRVTQLSDKQVELQVSIAYNQKSGVRDDISKNKTSSNSYYDDELLYINKEDLVKLHEAGAIYHASRP